MTSDVTRKAQFEIQEDDEGSLDPSGGFDVKKDAEEGDEAPDDEADSDDVSKAAGGLDVSDPSGGFASDAIEKSADVDAGGADEWTRMDLTDDGGSESVEKSDPAEAPPLDLNRQGSFATREKQLLGEIRDALVEYDEDVQAAVEKAVEDATADGSDETGGDPEGDLGDAFGTMLAKSEGVIEDAEALVEDDAEGEDWADLKERVAELTQRIHEAPDPETPAEVAAAETIRERAAKLADLIRPDEDTEGDAGSEAESGDDEEAEEQDA